MRPKFIANPNMPSNTVAVLSPGAIELVPPYFEFRNNEIVMYYRLDGRKIWLLKNVEVSNVASQEAG